MKSAVSLVVAGCLCGSMVPGRAAACDSAAADAIARSVEREALRLANERVISGGDRDWVKLRTLDSGADVDIRLVDGRRRRGRFVGSDDSMLTVASADHPQIVEQFARGDIAQIAVRMPHSPKRDALGGLLVGAIAYGAAGALLCDAFGGTGSCAPDVLRAAAVGGGVTAGMSVAAGAIKHAVRPALRVIYRAP